MGSSWNLRKGLRKFIETIKDKKYNTGCALLMRDIVHYYE